MGYYQDGLFRAISWY